MLSIVLLQYAETNPSCLLFNILSSPEQINALNFSGTSHPTLRYTVTKPMPCSAPATSWTMWFLAICYVVMSESYELLISCIDNVVFRLTH